VSAPHQILTRPRGGSVLTLSGEFVDETSGTGPWKVHIIFNPDGTVDRRNQSNSGNDTTTQVDGATDWIIPNVSAGDGSGFEIRMNSVPADSLDEEAAAFGVWVDISSPRVWGFTSSVQSDDDSGNLTFELRRVGGAVEASGVYGFVLDTV